LAQALVAPGFPSQRCEPYGANQLRRYGGGVRSVYHAPQRQAEIIVVKYR